MSFTKTPSVEPSDDMKLLPAIENQHTACEEIAITSTPSQSIHFTQNSDVKQSSPETTDVTKRIEDISALELDKIGTIVNQTIQELTSVYNDIGFTTSEITTKQEEIFTVIQHTISTFSSKVHQEKANIEDECIWLSQQIQIILAMINDNKGDKCLSLLERGLVFNNQDQYEDGYKEQVLTKFSNFSFHNSSPFKVNNSNIKNSGVSIEQQYDNMLNNIPKLSLLQKKSQLNSIFLKVLKSFMTSFRNLNNLSLEYHELVDLIGPYHTPDSNTSILQSLPSNTDSEYHKRILDEFEYAVQHLHPAPESDDFATRESNNYFIASSPRKSSIQGNSQPEHMMNTLKSPLEQLQNLNYQIIMIIRGLRFTRITSELLSSVQTEIDHCKKEIDQRKENVAMILTQIFQSMELLQMTDEKLKEIQKHNDNMDEDVLLDIETLKTIQKEPLEFGLHNSHIEFLSNIQNLLQCTVNSRRGKWEEYSKTCMQLWEKLGEDKEYVNSFMERNNSLTELSLLSFKMELNRLHIKRSEFIEKFISDSRNDIENLWDKMYYSRSMRSEFEFFNYDPETNDMDKEVVLSKHEQEIIKLNKEYTDKEPIFQLYEELQELLKDQSFLKEASKDSSRLMSKNSCKILLNEEKLRKKINKNMPRVLECLVSQVNECNNNLLNNGSSPLSINGEDLYEKLLSIQREQQSNGVRRNRHSTTGRVSPQKKIIQRTSPNKKPQQISRAGSSLKSFRESPTKTPVNRIIKPSLKAHSNRTYNNPTTIQISNAISSSFSSNSASPTRILGNITLNPLSELQPLNYPLKPLSSSSEQESPLRLNMSHKQKLGSPAFSKEKEDEDKENSSPFNFSPIRIKPHFFEKPNQIQSNIEETSTIIRDEYRTWRDEKIRQYQGN